MTNSDALVFVLALLLFGGVSAFLTFIMAGMSLHWLESQGWYIRLQTKKSASKDADAQ